MSVQASTIRSIFANGGDLSCGPASSGALYKPIVTDMVQKVEGIYWKAKVTVAPTAVHVSVNSVADTDANGVKVFYGEEAGVGVIDAPGYLYSDTFSGCVFYLYRGVGNQVYGVHAPRSSGRLVDPSVYFRNIGGKLLYYFDTAGQFTTAGQVTMATQGRVLACVGTSKITVFFVKCTYNKVAQIVDDTVIDNWRGHEIATPALPGAVTGGAAPTAAPKPGRFKRVQNFFLCNH